MDIGGGPMAKDAQATPSQSPWETQKLFYGGGGGNPDWGGDPRSGGDPEVVEGREGPTVPSPWQSMAAFGPWIEGPGVG